MLTLTVETQDGQTYHIRRNTAGKLFLSDATGFDIKFAHGSDKDAKKVITEIYDALHVLANDYEMSVEGLFGI